MFLDNQQNLILITTGDNCAVVNCGTNRQTKGIGVLKLPSKKLHRGWRREWLNEITKTRTVDAHFKNKVETDTVYTCERHFAEEDVEICKYLNSFFLYDFETICAQKQSFLVSLKPVTTTSAVNYFKGFFFCRETKFLLLHVSRVLLQLIHIPLQAITIRSSPNQTTWFFQLVKSSKSYSCTYNLLHIYYKLLIKPSWKTFLNQKFFQIVSRVKNPEKLT